MNDLTFIAPTKRTKMTRARAAKIFLRRNGICWNCRHQIRGEAWTVEHPQALALGGPDEDDQLWPIHVTKCRKQKDARDAAAIARRNRIITASYVDPAKPKQRFKRKLPTKAHPFGETILRDEATE